VPAVISRNLRPLWKDFQGTRKVRGEKNHQLFLYPKHTFRTACSYAFVQSPVEEGQDIICQAREPVASGAHWEEEEEAIVSQEDSGS
jgi:hypothetical protein